ncbi:MAG: metal-dependent hydrolase [Hydrogenophaga sp.]|uniref:metal-dependent hydrolase n=1 Tax=Hydrogenophaga sp. TaxID=1904254 RepID=UPI003D9BFDB5
MATYLHFAPALALAVAIGPQRIGWRLTLAGAVCAVLPDADFLLYVLHIDAYSGTYGHRGFTHSIGFALLVGALGALLAGRHPVRSRWLTATFLALCTFSHPLLDGLIDRGICNAWFWPLDGARHCLPWRPVPLQGVPLFGPDRLRQELLWIGLPLALLALAGAGTRRWCATRPSRGQASAMVVPTQRTDSPRALRQHRRQAVRAMAGALLARRARARACSHCFSKCE